jgi:hypothetical protein
LTGSPYFAGGVDRCGLAEPDDVAAGTSANVFRNLTFSVPTAGTNANKLVLQGTATTQVDGSINFVETNVLLYAPPLTHPTCGDTTGETTSVVLSQANLATAVNVVTGQSILVTVAFNFS